MSEIKHDNIHQALAAAYGEVGYVQKQKSAGLNYSYAGEAGLIEAIRPALVKHGIVMFVKSLMSVQQGEFTTTKGSNMTRSVVQVIVSFMHEGGTSIDVQSAGEGMDSGDKSLNKAMTGAYKYALRQTFCIETGDDPDKTPSEPVKQEHTKANSNGHKPEPLTLEEAMAIVGSNGVAYGDCTNDDLKGKKIGLLKAIKNAEGDQEKIADYQRKLDAANLIINRRNG